MQEIITRNVIFHEEIFHFSQLSHLSFLLKFRNILLLFPTESLTNQTPETSNLHNRTPSTSSASNTQNNPPASTTTRADRFTKQLGHLTEYLCIYVPSSLYPISAHFYLSKLNPECLKYIILISSIYEPTTCKQASEIKEWQLAMQDELSAFIRTNTWYITVLPPGKFSIDCKWVYKVKYNADASVERYKASW